jgi:hypothetical protein
VVVPRFFAVGRSRRFRSSSIAALAQELESGYGERFRPYGATLGIVPASFSGVTTVGEGIALELFPDDPKVWPWWGDFEADLPIRVRSRLSRAWSDAVSLGDAETWAVTQRDAYIEKLRASGD